MYLLSLNKEDAKSSPITVELLLPCHCWLLVCSSLSPLGLPWGWWLVSKLHLGPQCLAWGLAPTEEVLGGILTDSPGRGNWKPGLQFQLCQQFDLQNWTSIFLVWIRSQSFGLYGLAQPSHSWGMLAVHVHDHWVTLLSHSQASGSQSFAKWSC